MLTDSSFSAIQLIALISVVFGGSGSTLESASANRLHFSCLVGTECLYHMDVVV